MDELNKNGILIGDFFLLNYCDILVFFQVAKTTENSVFLVELKPQDYLDGTMISRKIRTSDKPLVITKNNTYRKTTYEIFPQVNFGQNWLPIKIDCDSKLFKIAEKDGRCPFPGYFYATPMPDCYKKYFKKNIKYIKNYA